MNFDALDAGCTRLHVFVPACCRRRPYVYVSVCRGLYFRLQVENGKGAMPAWADRLSEEEIQAVAEYVFKQATDAAWKY